MNKVKYGLKNVYYSKVSMSSDGTTVMYATPVAIKGAVNLSMAADQEITNIAADDNSKYVSVAENNGYTGTLEVLVLPESFLADCLGMTYNSSAGTVLENKDGQIAPFALLFEFSGDEKKTRHVLYNCLATNPDVASSTKDGAISAATTTLDITASPALDTGDIKYSCLEASSSTYTDWFTTVQVVNA